jgi:hypothetical protein
MNLSATVKEAVARHGPPNAEEHELRVHPGAESARNPAGTA